MRVWKRLSLALLAGALTVTAAGCSMESPTGSNNAPTPTTSTEDAGQTDAPAAPSGEFKVGIAAREITNDYNRDIIDGATRLFEEAGGTVT